MRTYADNFSFSAVAGTSEWESDVMGFRCHVGETLACMSFPKSMGAALYVQVSIGYSLDGSDTKYLKWLTVDAFEDRLLMAGLRRTRLHA